MKDGSKVELPDI